MAQVTVRVTRETRDAIWKLSRAEGRSMQAVVERAVKEYRRTRIIDEINQAYALLRHDPEGAAQLDAERALWESTGTDGVDGIDGKAAS